MKDHLTVNIKQSHLLSSFDKIFIYKHNLIFIICLLPNSSKTMYTLCYIFQFINVDYNYNNIHRFQLLSLVV